REELAGWEPLLVTAARSRGVSWASLATALGVGSRQAAERRYLRLRPSTTGETTGEKRVRAERTRRAADRVVVRWARLNSASLRRLAGQVSAAEGLIASARRHAERVHEALGNDDAALLLDPLAEMRTDLARSHSGLADQIGDITDHITRLRRQAREDRSDD
ncbi:MAG: hypothetical protein ACRDQZ_26890, partial [Mycobacteriales bacterium]